MDKDAIRITENFLSHEECDWYITLFKNSLDLIEPVKHLHGDEHLGGEHLEDKSVNTDVLHMHMVAEKNNGHTYANQQWKLLIDRLMNGPIPADYKFYYGQVVYWKNGLSLHPHLDDLYEPGGLTSLIYLNDDYEGGITTIGDIKIKPKKGLLVSFKGHEILHSVSMVTGDRYTMPIWYNTK